MDEPNSPRNRQRGGGARPGPAPRAPSERSSAQFELAAQPAPPAAHERFEPPVSAIAPLFRYRLEQIRRCRIAFELDINTRPTRRVLGGYYKSRQLVRVYAHDQQEGQRNLEELFDTFLHEVAHHLEYTEPHAFGARWCRRVPGLMHSRLFWHILGELKWRWADLCAQRRG